MFSFFILIVGQENNILTLLNARLCSVKSRMSRGTLAQASSIAAESLLKVSWGLKRAGLGLGHPPPSHKPHSCHCATAQSLDNLPTLCRAYLYLCKYYWARLKW